MLPVIPRIRRRAIPLACALLSCAAVAAGCGERPDERAAAPATSGVTAREPGAMPDTSRDGAAFVAVYAAGPYEEIRIVRATDGAIVVGGSTRFPDGTRIAVSLLRGGAQGPEAVATSSATVELGRFMSGPLAPYGGTPPAGSHAFRLTVPFGAADQAPEVLRAADDGRRFEGPDARRGPEGRIVHEITLETSL